MDKEIAYEEVVITEKNRSSIEVAFKNGRIERGYFMTTKRAELIRELKIGDTVIAVLNQRLHDEVPGVGTKEHLDRIIVLQDPGF